MQEFAKAYAMYNTTQQQAPKICPTALPPLDIHLKAKKKAKKVIIILTK